MTEEQKVQHARKMAGSKHVSLQLDEFLQNFSLAGLERSFESPEKLSAPEKKHILKYLCYFRTRESYQCPTLPSSEYTKALWE